MGRFGCLFAGLTLVFALLVCSLAGPLPPAAAISYSMPPTPPGGWEDRADPNLHPSPEAIVIAVSLARGCPADKIREVWNGWGLQAVDRLFALLDDDLWRPFQQYTLQVLFWCPHQEAHAQFEQRVRALIDLPVVPDNCPDMMMALQTLGRLRGEAALPILVELAESSNPGLAQAARCGIAAIQSHAAVDQFIRLSGRLPKEGTQGWQQYLDMLKGQARANDVMNTESGTRKGAEQCRKKPLH